MGATLHCIEGVPAVDDTAKNGVLAIEVGLLGVRDEEL